SSGCIVFPPGNVLTRSASPGFIGAQYSHSVRRAPIAKPNMGTPMLQFKRRQALRRGEVAERLIALVLKTSRRASASGVRIPPSPPQSRKFRKRKRRGTQVRSPPNLPAFPLAQLVLRLLDSRVSGRDPGSFGRFSPARARVPPQL